MTPIAEERKLIFTNLINGVPVDKVAQAFHRQTEKEVIEDFRFVALKIKSYCFARLIPYIAMDSISEAKTNRLQLLQLIEKVNLDVLPMFSRVQGIDVDGKMLDSMGVIS